MAVPTHLPKLVHAGRARSCRVFKTGYFHFNASQHTYTYTLNNFSKGKTSIVFVFSGGMWMKWGKGRTGGINGYGWTIVLAVERRERVGYCLFGRQGTRDTAERGISHLIHTQVLVVVSRCGQSQDSGTQSRSPVWMAGIQVLQPLPAASQGARQPEAGVQSRVRLQTCMCSYWLWSTKRCCTK